MRPYRIELETQNKGLRRVQLALEESLRYVESIVETIREPLIILDADLKIISANRNFYETFKVTPAETLERFIYDLGDKQWDIPRLRELLEEILPEKEAFDDFEVTHDFQDIGRKVMLLNARQIYRKDIGTKMILLAIEDITEHKRLESLLAESEERYRRLFETASDGIVLLEKREGKITHANPATEKMLGYTNKESIGNKLQDIGVMLDMGHFQATIQILNKSGISNYNDVPVKTKSGRYIDTDIYLVDRARVVQCNIRDITEHKQAEEELLENEKKYRELFDFLPIPVYEMDLEANITSANRAIHEMFGGTEEALKKGLKVWQILSPEDIDRSAENIQRLLRGEQIGGAEYTLVRLDGSVFSAFIISSVIYSNGTPVGIRGAIIDITERKQAEEELRKSKMLLESVFNSTQDLILVVNRDLRIVMSNWKSPLYAGHTEFPINAHCYEAFIHRDTPCEPCHALGVFNTGESVLVEYYNQYTKLFMEVNAYPIFDDNNHVIMIAEHVRDITERKRAEEHLRETLDRLRKAMGTTIQVMVSAVEARDPYTAGHQLRTADLARAIATEMGLPQDKIEGIRMAGSIHDIGKLSIPAEILSKPTKLTNIEFSLIKEHSRQGYEILKDVESPWPLAEIVYQHHERMNGSGYPRNLKGDDIIMEARIMAVADVVEAMASHRPYRPALGIDMALEEIEKNKATLYDNTVADACLRLFREKGFQLEGA
jgi:PAS domain S-box-containing protein